MSPGGEAQKDAAAREWRTPPSPVSRRSFEEGGSLACAEQLGLVGGSSGKGDVDNRLVGLRDERLFRTCVFDMVAGGV